MLEELAIASHAGFASIEYGRLLQVVYILKPVPVLDVTNLSLGQLRVRECTYRMSSFIATFILESLLVKPEEVSVPSQEISLDVSSV